MQPDFLMMNASQMLFYKFIIASPQSCRKAYKTAESRSYTQIATVNSVRVNVRQYTNFTAHGNNTVLSGIPGMSEN